jgi:4-carboxymuconolactone decarboxylase
MVSFGNFIWERTGLERRIVELAICVTARFWRSNVEWVAHARAAKRYGVSDQTLDDVMNLRAPASSPADEQIAVEISRSLHETHELPRELYDRAVATFGEQGLVELVATIGYYTTVSMTLNTFDIPVAEGEETPFPRE